MLEQIINFLTNPSLIDFMQQWLLALTSVVTAASAITALTPTKKDDRARTFLLTVLNFLALNIGNARKREDDNA